jgi:hypothetical protein
MTDFRYLWIAPYAGLWEPFLLEHSLAQAIASAGRTITMLHCEGVFNSYCPVMTSRRLDVNSSINEKRRVCSDCIFNSTKATKVAKYNVDLLDNYVDSDVRRRVAQTMESVTKDNFIDLVLDEIPIGRYATYLVLLNHKVSDVTDTEASWEEYLSDLRNALIVSFSAAAIFQTNTPTHLIVNNPFYPSNRVLVERALAQGVRVVVVTSGSFIPARYHTVGIYPHILSSQTLADSSVMAQSLEVPLSGLEVRAIGAHLKSLISGNDPWVYSIESSNPSTTEIRERLGVRESSAVAAVLVSSPDETRAAMQVDAQIERDHLLGYSDIPEFLSAAVRCAAQLPDIDFVFRLHPRLLPNKRESKVSPDLEKILRILENLPSNATINSPDDGLSLYDLLRISSCGINHSSSTGLEFMAYGVPVVQYDPVRMALYPRGFSRCIARHSDEEFTAAVSEAVLDSGGIELSRLAFRWFGVAMLRSLLHMQPIENYDSRLLESAPSTETYKLRKASRMTSRVRWRNFIPVRLRERMAGHLNRRTRIPQMLSEAEDLAWQEEFLFRLDTTSGDPIWEPPVTPRGTGTLETETRDILRELSDLRRILGDGDPR